MKAVVTGGAGFIGSHLVDLLLVNDYEVLIIDNLCTGSLNNVDQTSKKISFINHDIISHIIKKMLYMLYMHDFLRIQYIYS
jgi:UDP-glucose 4-epimerase